MAGRYQDPRFNNLSEILWFFFLEGKRGWGAALGCWLSLLLRKNIRSISWRHYSKLEIKNSYDDIEGIYYLQLSRHGSVHAQGVVPNMSYATCLRSI